MLSCSSGHGYFFFSLRDEESMVMTPPFLQCGPHTQLRSGVRGYCGFLGQSLFLGVGEGGVDTVCACASEGSQRPRARRRGVWWSQCARVTMLLRCGIEGPRLVATD